MLPQAKVVLLNVGALANHAGGICPAAHRRCRCSTTRRDCCPEPPKMMTSVSNRMALAAASSASRNVLPPKPRDAIHNATELRARKASQKAFAGATCPSQHATAGMWTPKVALIQARTSRSVPSRARRRPSSASSRVGFCRALVRRSGEFCMGTLNEV